MARRRTFGGPCRALEAKGKARQKVGEVKEAAKSIAYDLKHSDKKR